MEKEKITAEMIAPCGLDCALCKRALEKVNPCPGCLGPDENKPAFCASECGIILCRKRKENRYAYCDECPDYPCAGVMEKRKTGIRRSIRSHESPGENLRKIRESGMEPFWNANGSNGHARTAARLFPSIPGSAADAESNTARRLFR